MASINHPDKIVLDAYSDPQLETYGGNGTYNRFQNNLKTPILNARGIQLLNLNCINSALQLNDASMLMFFFYLGPSLIAGNLRCIRLHPSSFVPYPGFTNYVKNRYFNNATELATALNDAAATTGDISTFNPLFPIGTARPLFSYDTATRKFSVSYSAVQISPAAADDPNVIAAMTTTGASQIRMNAYNSSNTWATATPQPYQVGTTMNARIGFAISYNIRGLWWGAGSVVGCATSTGVPTAVDPIEADANPILLGAQNINVYLSIIGGSGLDSWSNRKNLLASIPIEVAPLNINSYTCSSVEKPAVTLPTEIYEMRVEFFDDNGTPFIQPPNYNTELVLSVYY